MNAAVYESREAWNPERPDTVIITCVDGRFYPHFWEFAREHLGMRGRVDMVAVPGGIEPLTLMNLVPKDFNFLRRRLEALIEAHGTRRVVAIAHQDCAWYRSRRIGPLTIDLAERQMHDLRAAAAHLRETFPGLTVETYFARLSDGVPPKVVFETVT